MPVQESVHIMPLFANYLCSKVRMYWRVVNCFVIFNSGCWLCDCFAYFISVLCVSIGMFALMQQYPDFFLFFSLIEDNKVTLTLAKTTAAHLLALAKGGTLHPLCFTPWSDFRLYPCRLSSLFMQFRAPASSLSILLKCMCHCHTETQHCYTLYSEVKQGCLWAPRAKSQISGGLLPLSWL